MPKFDFIDVVTKDKLLLPALVFEPTSSTKRTALIYVHGLGGDFYSNSEKANAFAEECNKYGFAFLTFNNRGSGYDAAVKKLDSKTDKGFVRVAAGRTYEKFSDCVYDIGAVISQAKKRGYNKIILIGHSTGANKVIYYLYKNQNQKNIVASVLTGALSDVPIQRKLSGKSYPKILALAKMLYKKGKGSVLLPEGSSDSPITAQRFLSLCVEKSEEDVFQYYLQNPAFTQLKSLKIPALFIIGEKDEYATTKPNQILKTYSKLKSNFETVLIKGSLHSFNKMEKKLAKIVCTWINKKVTL
ncbi:MAG: alpha/beta fold hydrolase [Candidatus Micrarchaeota archaeon]